MQVCLISDRRSNLVKTSQRVADVHKSLLLIYPSRLLRTFTCKYLLLHVVEVSVRLFRQILRIHSRAHQLIPTPHFPSNISLSCLHCWRTWYHTPSAHHHTHTRSPFPEEVRRSCLCDASPHGPYYRVIPTNNPTVCTWLYPVTC